EDRRRDGDAEREAEDRGDGERWRVPQRTQRESQVLQQVGHDFLAVRASCSALVDDDAGLTHRCHVAELPFGLGARVVESQAGGGEVADTLLDVKAELIVDVAMRPAAQRPEEPSPAFVAHEGCRVARSTLATASTNWVHVAVSARNCWRPRAVRR